MINMVLERVIILLILINMIILVIIDHLDVEKGDYYFMVMIIMFESGDQ